MTGNPMVTLNRAVAAAMVDGPTAGLALLDGLDDGSATTTGCTRCAPTCSSWPATAAAAAAEFRAAAARTTNLREQHYLTTQAARLATDGTG